MLKSYLPLWMWCTLQDTPQPEAHGVLQCHSFRRRTGVGLCLEDVEDLPQWSRERKACGSPGLHQASLDPQQVRMESSQNTSSRLFPNLFHNPVLGSDLQYVSCKLVCTVDMGPPGSQVQLKLYSLVLSQKNGFQSPQRNPAVSIQWLFCWFHTFK